MNSTKSNRYPVEEAAERLGVSVSWMNKARLTGAGPEFLKIGARVVYEEEALDAFAQSCRRRSTSAPHSSMEAA